MRKKYFLLQLSLLAVMCYSCKTTQTGLQTPPSEPINQGIIKITETDEAGRVIPLTASHKIIDPNSTLDIQLDKSRLVSSVSETGVDELITKRLTLLKAMLAAEESAIKALTEAIHHYQTGGNWTKPLGSLGPLVSLIFDDAEGMAVYNSLPTAATTDMYKQYQNLFVTARLLVDRIEQKIIDAAKAQGIYIQVGAFIDTKEGSHAVPLAGFDNYDPLKPFKVERFNVLLSDDQKKELEDLATAAKKANSEGLQAAFKAQENLQKLISIVLGSESFKKAGDLATTIKAFIVQLGANAGEVKTTLESAHAQLSQYKTFIESKVLAYSLPQQTDPASLLIGINTDISALVQRTNDLTVKMLETGSVMEAKFITIPTTLQASATAITVTWKSLQNSLTGTLDTLRIKTNEILKTLIEGENFRDRVHAFTDKVKKLTLDEMPFKTTLNLETAGKREPGDLLTIKVVKGKKNSEIQEVDVVRYRLYFCSPYAETATGFLFTDPVPFGKSDLNKSLFHYAPSYSILLKGLGNSDKLRKKMSYHTLFSPGIGINVSSLDFDANGALEVGVGGVFTILRNYIQLGGGVNTYDGRGYYFFGIRLPVGNFALK